MGRSEVEGTPISEVTAFSQSSREKFFQNFNDENEGEEFTGLEKNEFLRFAGIPNKLIVDEVNTAELADRLTKAQELGLLDMPEGLSWSYTNRRPIIFAKVAGEKIPFYRSSAGTGGNKTAGKWYPFFGIGEDDWLIKGGGDNFETSYNNPAFKKLQDILDKTLDWDHRLDLKLDSENEMPKDHPFYNKEGFCSLEDIDQTLYNEKELHFKPGGSGLGSAQWIKTIVERMYETYPQEVVSKIMKANQDKLRSLGYNF